MPPKHPHIDPYEALALFTNSLQTRKVLMRYYKIPGVIANGIIVRLLSEDLLEEPPHPHFHYRLTPRGHDLLSSSQKAPP